MAELFDAGGRLHLRAYAQFVRTGAFGAPAVHER